MRRVVMIVFAALLFLPEVMKNRMSRDLPAHTVFHVLSSGRVLVKISGDVLHPGIYAVSANSLALSVIELAEPLYSLKKSVIEPFAPRPLQSGSAVNLKVQPDGLFLITRDQMAVPERIALGIPLEISTMNEADFDRLPGIGPALARRIVEYRQTNGGSLRADDLAAVSGIGKKKFKVIRSYFQPPLNTGKIKD